MQPVNLIAREACEYFISGCETSRALEIRNAVRLQTFEEGVERIIVLGIPVRQPMIQGPAQLYRRHSPRMLRHRSLPHSLQ